MENEFFIHSLTHSLLADCFPWQPHHTKGFVQVMNQNHKKSMQPWHLVTTCMLQWNNTWQNTISIVLLYFDWCRFQIKTFLSNVNILILVRYSVPSCRTDMATGYAIAYHRAERVKWDFRHLLCTVHQEPGFIYNPVYTSPTACRNCFRVFKHKQTMFRHRKQCEGNFNFACGVCGKRFYRRDNYQLHLKNKHQMVDEMKGKLKTPRS